MAFLIHTTADGHQVPWEYLPCDDIQPFVGMPMVLSGGLLVRCGATAKPGFISMYDAPATLAEGDIIPVIRVTEDIIFETTNSASLNGVGIGAKVTLTTTGDAQVTATTTSGVAEIVDKVAGTGTGNRTLVKF